MSFLSMMGMFKSRAVVYVVGSIILVFGLIAWHKTAVKRAVEAESDKLTLSFEKSKNEAIKATVANADEAIKNAKIESEKQNAKIKQDAAILIAKHNNGTGRLSVPARCTSPSANGTGAHTAAPVAETRAELSDESVRFFVGEAKRADEVVIERNELLSIIEQLKATK